jgi:hypothetical protein
MARQFNAVLTDDISFVDLRGAGVTIKKGDLVQVTVSEETLACDHLDGSIAHLPAGAIIGSKGKHSFDLAANEFVPVN